MRFHPNDDQATFISALEQMMKGDGAAWKTSPQWDRFDWSPAFDSELDASGFLDCANEETLGRVSAAAMIYRLSGLPIAVESAASALLRAQFAPSLPRPIAIVQGDARHAVRFLPVAKSVLSIHGTQIRAAVLSDNACTRVESLFAYPMGVLNTDALTWADFDCDADAVRDAWRVAVAAELAGALKGGLDAVVTHVRNRHQFGRALGSFQAIQHRLAAAAGKIEAAYWLTLKAAQNLDRADAATALGYVQEASTKIVYDLHQFMGAMGLTLEHPLHRWTYRVRLLRSAFGGAAENFSTLAERRWRAA